MGRKRPHPSPPDGGATFPIVGKVKEPMTEADRAYAHAVEVCDRIIRELEEELSHGKNSNRPSDP